MTDSFERAKEKLRLAEVQSDVNTDTEEKTNRWKRAKRDFVDFDDRQFSDSSDDEPNSLMAMAVKIPEHPQPPKLIRKTPPVCTPPVSPQSQSSQSTVTRISNSSPVERQGKTLTSLSFWQIYIQNTYIILILLAGLNLKLPIKLDETI